MRPRGFRAEQAFDAREPAELLPDTLDLLRAPGTVLAQLREARPPGGVVCEELLRELAAAHVLEHLAHPLLDGVVDDARPDGEVAVLRDVRHRVAHVLVAALIEQ